MSILHLWNEALEVSGAAYWLWAFRTQWRSDYLKTGMHHDNWSMPRLLKWIGVWAFVSPFHAPITRANNRTDDQKLVSSNRAKRIGALIAGEAGPEKLRNKTARIKQLEARNQELERELEI